MSAEAGGMQMPKLPHVVIFSSDHYRGDVPGHMGSPAAVTPRFR